MSKFEGAVKIGLRDSESLKLIAVYPGRIEGSDDEISKNVKDWFYKQSCSAEETLRNAYVDVLTENEMKSYGV
jgi:hypothetical protein